jgi:hypothetical protein
MQDHDTFQPLSPFLKFNESSVPPLEEAVKHAYYHEDGTCFFDVDQYRLQIQYGEMKWQGMDQSTLIAAGKQLVEMSKEEFLALYLYTSEANPRDLSLYRNLNRDLTSSNRSLATKWAYYLHYLISALRKIPAQKMNQDLYRGVSRNLVSLNPAKYCKGKMIVEYAVTSTTCLFKTVVGFVGSGSSTIFTINGAFSARSITPYSAMPSEDEYVFSPTTRFQICSIAKLGLTTTIQMKQVPSLEDGFFQLENLSSLNNLESKPNSSAPLPTHPVSSLAISSFPGSLNSPHIPPSSSPYLSSSSSNSSSSSSSLPQVDSVHAIAQKSLLKGFPDSC